MHHVACLLKLGLHRGHFGTTEPGKPKAVGSGIALGGVSCTFRREIKPYEPYEIWTRVLAWDKKWLYLVSHIVKKGAVKPTEYTLQPWKNGSIKKKALEETASTAPTPHPAIFATSIAKYVFKQGRITVPPEIALTQSELLPPKPEGVETPSVSATPLVNGTPPEDDQTIAKEATEALEKLTQQELVEGPIKDGVWDWTAMEAERAKGMLVAQHFAGLDGLYSAFTADGGPALGQY